MFYDGPHSWNGREWAVRRRGAHVHHAGRHWFDGASSYQLACSFIASQALVNVLWLSLMMTMLLTAKLRRYDQTKSRQIVSKFKSNVFKIVTSWWRLESNLFHVAITLSKVYMHVRCIFKGLACRVFNLYHPSFLWFTLQFSRFSFPCVSLNRNRLFRGRSGTLISVYRLPCVF